MGGLLLHVGLSLLAVLALVLVVAQILGTRNKRAARLVNVVSRTQLTKGSAVAVVQVADRALVVGATDHRVTLLAEADSELLGEAAQPQRRKHPRHAPDSPEISHTAEIVPGFAEVMDQAMDQALEEALVQEKTNWRSGSILSATTWRRALDALRERSVRR
jgi:flagellar protein FliO/FliZ